MNFLIDENLSPRLPALLAARGHEARQVRTEGHGGDPDRDQFQRAIGFDALITSDSHQDAKTRPVFFQATFQAIRVIYLKPHKAGRFPAEMQAGWLARHFAEIEREVRDPAGARFMAIVDLGTTLKLTPRGEIGMRLDQRGIEPRPPGGPGGA